MTGVNQLLSFLAYESSGTTQPGDTDSESGFLNPKGTKVPIPTLAIDKCPMHSQPVLPS